MESVIRDTCRFNQYPCNFTKDFHWTYIYKYGNCFEFNSGYDMNNQEVELKRQNSIGEISALIFDIHISFSQ